MMVPIQVAFRNMPPSDAVEARIREEAAKLENYYDRITSCRVVVETPHRHHARGHAYHIRIELGVPGGELVIQREPSLHADELHREIEKETKSLGIPAAHRDVYVAIRDAFDAARRRLQDHVRRLRGDQKRHEEPPRGSVKSLNPEGYGFLETKDGREIYFHESSVVDAGFDKLQPGAEVAFVEVPGQEGPRASTVKQVRKRRHVPETCRRVPIPRG